jgi:serine/threonine-protein kinase HipA
MSLARAVGLDVPKVELLHLPEAIYLVARYDRALDAGVVKRRHQIDLCQMLNKPPSFKYESEGGATFSDAFHGAVMTVVPGQAKLELLRRQVFNYLIGNSDAHAKNIAFLVDESGIRLAPAYDLLSVRVYGDTYDYLAMSVGEQNRYGHIERADWDAMCDSLGIKPNVVRAIRKQYAKRVPALARQLANDAAYTDAERGLIAEIIDLIDRHASWLV